MSKDTLVLIAEDDETIARFIAATLNAHGYDCAAAARGGEIIGLVASRAPDLLLLDLGLPDMDGAEVLKRVRAWSKLPVIVVSARADEREKVRAFDLGADDYIVKPFGTAELLARIRTALRHSAAPDASPAGSVTIGELEIDYEKRAVFLHGRGVHVTPIEYAILVLLSRNAGKVLTQDYIMGQIWGPGCADSHTLRVNMANIRRKLEENPGEPRYILTEMGVGYRMAEG